MQRALTRFKRCDEAERFFPARKFSTANAALDARLKTFTLVFNHASDKENKR